MFVIVVVSVALYLLRRATPIIGRHVGQTGLTVFERVMGLIIGAIGVEFILDGIAGHLAQIETIHD